MNSNPQGRGNQFAREARIGLTIIGVLMAVLAWFAYRRFSANGDPVADLRREAQERRASRIEQSTGTPHHRAARGEIANRVPSSDEAVSAPARGLAPKTYGVNPAQSQPFQLDRGSSSATAPAPGNPAFSNPANNQPSPQVASSFYNRGNDSIAQGKSSPPKANAGGSGSKPKATASQAAKPEELANSSGGSLDEPIIEFGQEASPNELVAPNSAPRIQSTDSIVETEPPDSPTQPSARPEQLAVSPSTVQPGNAQSATQLPSVGNKKTGGIPAEMISTTLNKVQTFVVQENDTFWSISQRAYGTGHYFKALHEYNKGHVNDPDNLPVGQKIVAPPLGTLRSKYPDLVRQKDSVNQTSYEQTDNAPPVHPQFVETAEMHADLRPIPVDDSAAKEQSAPEEDSIPQFDLQPNPPGSEPFLPPAEPARADDSPAADAQPRPQPQTEIPPPPGVETGEKQASRLVVSYIVREGDNLFNIARNELLQASRYLDILQLNQDDLPADCTHLTPLPAGLKLKLPNR